MGIFGNFMYKSKKSDKKYWLHSTERGKVTLYFFSQNPIDALPSLPGGYEVIENKITGMPLLKKKGGKKGEKKK
ncbi:hypothetical protein ACFLQN_01375 [Candidatus Aenigmatarchaeota archaeon]